MRRCFVSILFAVFAMGHCAAQTELDSCRTWARERYPLAKQYQFIEQSRDYTLSNAARMWLPRLGVLAQGTWQSEAMGISQLLDDLPIASTPMIAGLIPDWNMKQWQGKVQMEVQQNIWDGGISAAQRGIARQEAAAQSAQTDVEMGKLDDRVDQLFFAILLLEEQQNQLQGMSTLLESHLALARALCQNEVILPSEVDAVEAERLALEQRQLQIESGADAYRQMLSRLCGREIVPGSLTQPTPTALQRKTPLEHLLFDAQKMLIAAKEKALIATTMPQLGAFAQGWYGYPRLNMFESMKTGEWGFSAIVGVAMRWNLGAFYTLHNDRQKLDLTQQQVVMQQELFALNDSLQQTQNSAEVQRLRDVIASDERIVALRTSIRQSTEARYAQGTITTNELLQKVNDETQARCTLVLHQIELQRLLSQIYNR